MKSKMFRRCAAATLAAAMGLAGVSASAQTVTIGSTSVAAGANAVITVNYTANGAVPVNSFGVQFTFTRAPFAVASGTVTAVGAGNGFSCGGNATVNATGTTLSVAGFDGGGGALNSGLVCTFTIPTDAGAAAAAYPFTVTFSEFTDTGGGDVTPGSTVVNGAVTITGGGVNTPPTIAYNPIVGTSINYAANGTAAAIVATPSGGAGAGAAATTTVGACTITGGGAAFPTTNIAQLSFVGATVTPQNINLPACVPQAAAATNATLTCPESQGGGAAADRIWPLVCPQAAVAAVPPTLTYAPAAGSTTNVAAGAATTINVGCPTDGSPCNGSGTGLAATSRLESLSASFIGLASPSPTMTCNFVNEGGTVLGGGNLDFVAAAADPGDISCTCPPNTTGLPESFRVDVTERSPASGAGTAVRSFTIACNGNQACGTISATPAGSTVALANGGAASLVTTVTVAGIVNEQQTVSCVTSNVSAGSTFTVTTTPTPMVLNSTTTSGTVNATCNNTATTTGTATLTCTSVSTGILCPTLNEVYTLSCPGVNVPPVVTNSVPVPALNEQGRILLAALVLLLGLGVVGFRMRG